MALVYIIKNKINGKVYIGKTSTSLDVRFRRHINDSHKKHCIKTRVLYMAMNKYGTTNFSIEILEDNLSDNEACKKETYYIKKYRSFVGYTNSNGYNMTLGGDGPHYANYELIVDTLIKNKLNKSKTAKTLHCTRRTVCLACNELGIQTKPKSVPKIVKMYDKNTMEVLKTFTSLKSATKYINEISTFKGAVLYKSNSYIINNYLFIVLRDEEPKNHFKKKSSIGDRPRGNSQGVQ